MCDQFTAKYGKPYAQACKENAVGTVSAKLMHKLSVQAPPKITVEKYLIEIARYSAKYHSSNSAPNNLPPAGTTMLSTSLTLRSCPRMRFTPQVRHSQPVGDNKNTFSDNLIELAPAPPNKNDLDNMGAGGGSSGGGGGGG